MTESTAPLPGSPLESEARPSINESFTDEMIDRLAVTPTPGSLWGQVNDAFEAKTGKRFHFILEGRWNIFEDTVDVVVGYAGIAVLPTEITEVSTRGNYGFVVTALANHLAEAYDEAFAM